MSKVIGLGFAAAVLLLAPANPTQEKFTKYKAVEAYEIRPGILMMPRHSADGQVCEIGLEKLHYSPELIRLSSSLSRKEINQVFDEIVPADERGPEVKDPLGTLITQVGQNLTTNIDFKNVSIQIYGAVSATVKGETTVDEIVATIKLKNRTCQ